MKKIITLLVFSLCLMEVWSQGQLQLNQGLQWVNSGNVQIVLQDTRMQLDGDFLPGFSRIGIYGQGSPSQSALAGAQTLNFFDLYLSHDGEGTLLEQDIVVSHEMSFSSGKLNLNGHELDLGNTGFLLGESESSRIVGPVGGQVHAFAYLNVPNWANPGNLGLEISSTHNLDSVHISRGHKLQAVHAGQSIERYYDVSAALQGQMIDTLRFHYFEAELDTTLESNLGLFHSADLGSNWTVIGGNTMVISGSNFAEQNMIDPTGRVTLANKNLATDLEDSFSPLNAWLVYPNPTEGVVIVELDLATGSKVDLRLIDTRGREIYLESHNLLSGQQSLKLDFGPLAEGLYHLILLTEGKQYTRKLIVL